MTTVMFINWLICILTGIGFGFLGSLIIHVPKIRSSRTLLGSGICAVVVLFMAWLSAPEYNPLNTELRYPIFLGAALAALTFPIAAWLPIRRKK